MTAEQTTNKAPGLNTGGFDALNPQGARPGVNP